MQISRRSLITSIAAAAVTSCSGRKTTGDDARTIDSKDQRESLPVAAVVTVYRRHSHADVIVGKILEGWQQDSGRGPDLKLVALYVDQVPEGDLSRKLADRHGFHLAKSIDEALTLGQDRLAVAGVLSIAEHGDYPKLEKTGQKMYPRRRFFDQIVATMRRCDQFVPIFSDKHLAYQWRDAKHMYDRARQLQIPLMAGSSLPVTWRHPSTELALGGQIDEAFALGYGGIESYGFHALEALQAIIERRQGGETGIRAVTTLRGSQILAAAERGQWSTELLLAAAAAIQEPMGDWQRRIDEKSALFRLEFRDGLRASVAMLTGFGDKFAVACKLKQKPTPLAWWLRLEDKPPYGHFAHLLRAIESMIHTRQPAYPVERTLLTTGALDRALQSYALGGQRLSTPELDVSYRPSNWSFARHPDH